uniref:hypothetical protein n=1 Tax=uncultured Lactobacillus sp. TaxID=153152 RepID=UPI002626CFFC
MTEKRAQYRKKQKQSNLSRLLKRAESDRKKSNDEINVNPDFVKDNNEKGVNSSSRQQYFDNEKADLREQKTQRLRKRLNWAIFIVICLIVIVLVALFN